MENFWLIRNFINPNLGFLVVGSQLDVNGKTTASLSSSRNRMTMYLAAGDVNATEWWLRSGYRNVVRTVARWVVYIVKTTGHED